jgi:integrase
LITGIEHSEGLRGNEDLKSLIAYLYATGCRIDELKAIKAEDITFQEDVTIGQFILIKSPTLKRHSIKENPKWVPVSINQEPWLTEIILGYAKDRQGILFRRCRKTYWAWCILLNPLIWSITHPNPDGWQLEYLKKPVINPHGWRKIRATHLSSPLFNFNGHQLKSFFNWARLESSTPYVKLNALDRIPLLTRDVPK